MSNPERSAISVTSCLADFGSCSNCQQGGLLQLSPRWCWSMLLCQLQDRLQSVLNAATRLVFSARRSECITPLLHELHWLRVPERVTFRLCVLAYRSLHGTAPSYLAASFLRISDIDTRRRLHGAFCRLSHILRLSDNLFNSGRRVWLGQSNEHCTLQRPIILALPLHHPTLNMRGGFRSPGCTLIYPSSETHPAAPSEPCAGPETYNEALMLVCL